jgi:hypothetical protein
MKMAIPSVDYMYTLTLRLFYSTFFTLNKTIYLFLMKYSFRILNISLLCPINNINQLLETIDAWIVVIQEF